MPSPRTPVVLLCAALSSCQPAETPWEQCTDAACRAAWLSAHGRQDPMTAAVRIAALGDPIEQTTLITALINDDAGAAEDLCTVMPAGPGRQRCDLMATRPHLQAPTGPKASHPFEYPPLPWIPEELSPFAALTPAPLGCDARLDACWQDRLERAERDRATTAEIAALCAAIPTRDLRQECCFKAAAAVSSDTTHISVERVVSLCLAAGSYAGPCLHEALLMKGVRAHTPAATEEHREAWHWLRDLAHDSERELTRLGHPREGALLRDRIWAEAMTVAYGDTETLVGTPLDLTPEEAHPHIRAAIAWHLVETVEATDPPASFATQLELAEAVVAARGTAGLPVARLRSPHRAPGWMSTPVEPGVFFLDDARRPTSEDPQVDLALALLAAAARSSRDDLLVEVSASPDPLLAHAAAAMRARPTRVPLPRI
ncbi:MAG: hypothetical protein ABIO70_26705 [Pseudomonadota bacterium]